MFLIEALVEHAALQAPLVITLIVLYSLPWANLLLKHGAHMRTASFVLWIAGIGVIYLVFGVFPALASSGWVSRSRVGGILGSLACLAVLPVCVGLVVWALRFDKREKLRAGLLEALREANRPLRIQAIVDILAEDKLLPGADLGRIELGGIYLAGADIRRAKMRQTDCTQAELMDVDLHRSDLFLVCLEGAEMMGANLKGADLTKANLREAQLDNASLERANLIKADLRGAELSGVQFSQSSVLPDGSRWEPDVDMARFTDPEHPDFWRSDDPWSPAYHGRGRGEGN